MLADWSSATNCLSGSDARAEGPIHMSGLVAFLYNVGLTSVNFLKYGLS